MKFIDLTHILKDGLPVYPGDVPPRLQQTASVEKDGIAKYELISAMHAGTHIDAPMHMIEGGKKISEFLPEKFVGRGVLIDARGQDVISAALLEGKDIQVGDIVIVVTGWYKRFGTQEYFFSFPQVTKEFAQKLAALKVSILGLDTPSPDATPPYTEHRALLEKDILIIENLNNTEALLGVDSFEIIALPLNIEADASLLRVVAKLH